MHTLKHIVGYLLPVFVLVLFFWLYSNWQFSGHEILNTTGFSGLTLFGIIFIIGPLPRFWADLSPWKVFRPYWAKWAVLIMFVHFLTAYVVEYDQNLLAMFSRENQNLLGMSLGLAAFLYFVFMVVISEQSIRARLGKHWKQLHTVGYAAFALAVLHFISMENDSGHFQIQRLVGRLAFSFAIIVLVTRGYVFIWAKLTEKQEAPVPPAPPSLTETTKEPEPPTSSTDQ